VPRRPVRTNPRHATHRRGPHSTGPFIEKIQKAKYYDDAGEVIVEMNLDNTPPDLQTYNFSER